MNITDAWFSKYEQLQIDSRVLIEAAIELRKLNRPQAKEKLQSASALIHQQQFMLSELIAAHPDEDLTELNEMHKLTADNLRMVNDRINAQP